MPERVPIETGRAVWSLNPYDAERIDRLALQIDARWLA